MRADLGDLEEAFGLYEEGRCAAARFGDGLALRWLEVERMYEHYWRGEWDSALAVGAGVLGTTGGPAAVVHDADVSLVRGKIALAREGAEPALEHAERALERARALDVPQNLLPALALDAHALVVAGRLDEAKAAADELLTVWLEHGRGFSLASFWLADLSFALAALDGDWSVGDLRARTRTPTRWLDAAEAAAGRDWLRAARVFAAIGSRPDEALARLKAAEALLEAGRRAEAEAELTAAAAFAEPAGAAAWGRAAEALAAKP